VVELAEIFRQHGSAYRAGYGIRMPPSHHRAMRDIENCRTEALGGHVYICPDCEQIQYSYHSCKNRHCPKCQQDEAQRWLEGQQQLWLPVPYFFITFTLPSALRTCALRHQKECYHLLFNASAAALQELARDPRFVGGQVGLIGVLHTWARNLIYHPHVHYLVPGGGLSEDEAFWQSSRKSFFLPVKPLSILFRAKFRDALKKRDWFDQIPGEIWSKDWVVHCQPVGNGVAALKYLAPYIFRVALTNRRILKMENGKITFAYKDSNSGENRTCTLQADEFIRRFLQHVLPKGFVKVRYFGFFSSGKRQMLFKIRRLLGKSCGLESPLKKSNHSISDLRCPKCGCLMRWLQSLQPQSRSPPHRCALDAS
jgi:hypothetical protein